MEKDRCPRCGASTLATGSLTDRNGFTETPWYFTPSWHRFVFFRWKKGVFMYGRFTSCLCCGLVWSDLEAEKLRAFTERYGNAEAKASLSAFVKPAADAELRSTD